jgi:hypothetical protein
MALSELNERKWVLLLCVFAAIHVFIFSATFPFFNDVDEQAHFDLVVKYSHGHVPRTLENMCCRLLPAGRFRRQCGHGPPIRRRLCCPPGRRNGLIQTMKPHNRRSIMQWRVCGGVSENGADFMVDFCFIGSAF